jgi:hypothetical protein
MKNYVVMLDSGAWTAHTKGMTINLDKYAEFVHRNKHLFGGGVFNLDFIDPPVSAAYQTESAEKSYKNWIELRKLGIDTIPVHHIGDDDESYLKKYLEQTDYIGIGAIAKLNAEARIYGLDYIWKEYLSNKDGTPRYRCHGLGLTDIKITLRYPWFSVDSTRAIMLAAHGGILLPKLDGDKFSYREIYQVAVSNQGRSHYRGKGDSFYGMSKLIQGQIKHYCTSLGYELDDSIAGRTLNPLMKSRKKVDGKWTSDFASRQLGFPEEAALADAPLVSNNVDEKNLSASWVPRFIFNLYVSDQFIKYWRTQGKTIRIYNVVGGGNVFDTFVVGSQSVPANRCLVSYARLSGSFLDRLKEVVNGHH